MNTRQRLNRISELEKKHNVLGCGIYTKGRTTTEEASQSVLNLLETLDDIEEGRIKMHCPDFELLDKIK